MSTGLVLLPRNRCSVQVGTISAIKNPVPICQNDVRCDGGAGWWTEETRLRCDEFLVRVQWPCPRGSLLR